MTVLSTKLACAAAAGLLATLALAGCAGTLPRIDSSAGSFSRKATGTVDVWCRAATQTGPSVARWIASGVNSDSRRPTAADRANASRISG